jgi:hypothetical protein
MKPQNASDYKKYKLESTLEYERFEMLDFNRDVKKTKKLEASMRKWGWIPAYPCHVVKQKSNGKLLIKGGHHRFTVAATLNIPVLYVLCEDDASVFELEAASLNWSLDDYLTAYRRLGDNDYEQVYQWQQKHDLPLSSVISMLGGEVASSSNKQCQFKAGEYAVVTTDHITAVCDVVDAIKRKVKWGSESLIVQAMSRLVMAGQADLVRLKKKIANNPALLMKQPSLAHYMTMFEQVYNHQAKDKVPLVHLTDKVMKQRQKSFGKIEQE